MQIDTSYSQAIGRKYPEQIVIAIAKDEQGKYNPITLGWTMITSGNPPMMAISVGLTRYSLSAIRQAKEFVVSFPSTTMEKEVTVFGSKSGRDTDKLALTGSPVQKAHKIDCVILDSAVANFECVLESELTTGDHVIFVGRVVQSHANVDENVRRLYTMGGGYSGVREG